MRKILIIAAVLVGLVLTTVLVCELLSRKYYASCLSQPFEEIVSRSEELSCFGLGEKYGTSEKELPPLLFEIKAKRESGARVSKQEYRSLFEVLIVEVDRKDIGGNNGVACGQWGYVARDLSGSAKVFVRRHELAHILGVGDEFQANKEAALEYPFGFVQTVILSTWRGLTNRDRPFVCNIVSLWTSFKEYCLPWSWEPPIIVF